MPVPADLAHLAAPLTPAHDRTLPVIPSLEPLLPDGLRRGVVVSVDRPSLALALCAGPSEGGSWSAAVGAPALGYVAAAQAGVRLERLAVVPAPGEAWAQVTAALLDAVDVVVLRVPAHPRPRELRALGARTRDRGAVLVSLGPWEGAELRLRVTGERWAGLGPGWGHLTGRELEVAAAGRGTYARPRRGTIRVA